MNIHLMVEGSLGLLLEISKTSLSLILPTVMPLLRTISPISLRTLEGDMLGVDVLKDLTLGHLVSMLVIK